MTQSLVTSIAMMVSNDPWLQAHTIAGECPGIFVEEFEEASKNKTMKRFIDILPAAHVSHEYDANTASGDEGALSVRVTISLSAMRCFNEIHNELAAELSATSKKFAVARDDGGLFD